MPNQRFNEYSPSQWTERFLTSPDAEERYRALQGVIATAQPEEAVRVVQQGLCDADSAVRAGAARWLARQASESPAPGTGADWPSIQTTWERLLGDEDPDVRFESARGLLAITADHAAGLETLLVFLRDPETQPPMQISLLKVLSRIKVNLPADGGLWLPLLQSSQAEVREEAAKAVGVCGHCSANETASAIAALLEDEEPFVREEAARALGRLSIAQTGILTALEAATSDEDSLVAEAARAALSALRKPPQ